MCPFFRRRCKAGDVLKINPNLSVWIHRCLHFNYTELAKLFLDYARVDHCHVSATLIPSICYDTYLQAFWDDDDSEGNISSLTLILSRLTPAHNLSIIKYMLDKGEYSK